jgi:hypothetical protein
VCHHRCAAIYLGVLGAHGEIAGRDVITNEAKALVASVQELLRAGEQRLTIRGFGANCE